MKTGAVILGLVIFTLTSCTTTPPETGSEVKVVGEMKSVMWKGQLQGTIHLDTIADKTHLYGLGPVEYLAGEILVLDGKSYQSTVTSDTTMKVEETFNIKAPFFGYANISTWAEQALPDSIETIPQLEQFLDQVSLNSPRPFMFKLTGTVQQATIHIVNLPKGAKVSSPEGNYSGYKTLEFKN